MTNDRMTEPAAFLRSCLRLRQHPEDAQALRAAAGELAGRWERMRGLVEAERLGPLLWRTLGKRDILPPAIERELRWHYRIAAVRNGLLLRELAACLRAFAAARVKAIVLKGAALAEGIYGDVALRPMVDVDLLIPARDRTTARRVLEGLGYGLSGAETHPGVLAEQESEIDFCKPGPLGPHVDLHWSLFDSPHYQRCLDLDWFWQTAEPACIAGDPALVLGPEAQILHLCGHLALHHASRGLLWWHDVAAVLIARAGRLDWNELLARARRYDLQLPLQRVLVDVAEQWGAPVPAEVLAVLRNVRPSRDETWLFARLGRDQPPAGRRFWIDLVSMSGWSERWRFAATTLFPSAAYMRWRYAIRHPLLLPFYYPYRWLRGLRGI